MPLLEFAGQRRAIIRHAPVSTGQCVKQVEKGKAANDEFQTANSALQRGERVRELLQQRVKLPFDEKHLQCLLVRPELNQVLMGSLVPAGLLNIYGPCGYGKSAAATQALLASDFCSAHFRWVTLNAQDNAPERFLMLLAVALNQPEPVHSGAFSDGLQWLLAATERPDSASLLPKVLVLDNLDAICNPAALALLQQLVDNLPAQLRLLGISRGPLAVSTHSLDLQNRFTSLGPDKLEFSRSEVFEFFASELQQQKLTTVSVDNLYSLTEGWPTPLALYRGELRSGRERKALQDTASVQRFLADAVLGHYTNAQLLALRALAELDVFSDDLFASLADTTIELALSPSQTALAQTTPTPVTLSQLVPSQAVERGLPAKLMAGRGRWYRLNPLLLDWLQTPVLNGSAQRMLRVSEWFAQRRQYSEGLKYALMSADVGQIRRMAAEGSEALLLGQDTASLLRLRFSLPATALAANPRLRLVFGWVHAIGGQCRQATELVEHLGKVEAHDIPLGRIQALQAFIARGQGQVEPALVLAEAALKDPELSVQGQLVTQLVRSSALCALGRFADARQASREAARLARQAGDTGSEALAVYAHARIELSKGELRHTEHLLRSSLDTAMQELARPARVGEIRLQLNLALVLLHQGRYQDVDRVLAVCTRQAEQTRDLGLLMAMCLRVLICRSQSHFDEAFAWIARAERTMQSWQVDGELYVPVLEALKASCWLAQRETDRAAQAMTKIVPYRQAGYSPELFPTMLGLMDCLQVRVAMARGEYGAARTQLNGLRAGYRDSMPMGVDLHMSLLDAVLLAREKSPAQAVKRLVSIVELAAKEHFISPFTELKQELEPLLRQTLDQLPTGVFTDALVKLFGIKAATSATRVIVPLAEPISEREKGVLECIARGLSNQEVADKLHISLHTVKTHARRINAKLGVKSRTQAIVRARELGVL
jgi:LuxR family maltose regulon positive regulatory protein